MSHKIEYAEKCDASWQVHNVDGSRYVIKCRICGTTLCSNGTPKCLLNKGSVIRSAAPESIGEAILKNQYEIYSPLRKEVVDVSKIIEAFANAGFDIQPSIEF